MATKSKIDCIYCRYSSELQRDDSNTDQERRARDHLARNAIPHAGFEVIADQAISGTREDRAGFQRLKELIYSERLGTLVVTEMSRLSRGDDVKSLIKDIVFRGGRFISLQEGIDTDRKGWQLLVGVGEIHHSHSNQDTADRVRGGQTGRVLDENGSAGDYPYGYTSEFVDPAAAASYRGRGPKPKKKVVIDQAAKAIVLEVFERLARGDSIRSIVQWWESVKHLHPPITKTVVRHQHVRRILANQKYIGKWTFGQTTTIRDGRGQKKQVPARPDQQVVSVDRPDLRIVPQALWEAAQRRLGQLRDVYGMKAAHHRRGPSAHYRLLYERSLLGGLIYCGGCGARLHVGSGGKVKRLRCPNHAAGTCQMSLGMPYARAEAEVLDLLGGLLSRCPDWLTAALTHAKMAVAELVARLPDETTRLQHRLREVQQQIDNLVAAIGRGEHSEAVSTRLRVLEGEQAKLQAELAEMAVLHQAGKQMPDEQWLREQLSDLRGLLTAELPQLAPAIRPLLGKIVAHPVLHATKTRGYIKLVFKLEGWSMLKTMLVGTLPQHVLDKLHPSTSGETFEIDLGQPTRYDLSASKIVAMRNAGYKWREIAAATGISIGNASNLYARHQGGPAVNEPEKDVDGQAA